MVLIVMGRSDPGSKEQHSCDGRDDTHSGRHRHSGQNAVPHLILNSPTARPASSGIVPEFKLSNRLCPDFDSAPVLPLPRKMQALSFLPILRNTLRPTFSQGQLSRLPGAISRASTTVAVENLPEKYSKGTSALHWMMAIGIGTCFSTVQGAMNTKDNTLKGQLMT